MKVTIGVDCTPQEARAFLGLPAVEGLQDEMMEAIKERLGEHLKAMDPDTMMKTWVPMGLEAVNAIQRAFTDSLRGPSSSTTSGDE